MNGIFIITTFSFFILTVFVLVWRGLSQLKRIELSMAFFVLTYIGLICFSSSLLLSKVQIVSFDYIFISRISLGLVSFSLFSLCVLLIIDKITSKKLRTLLRLPIIGFLLGLYLPIEKLSLVVWGIELIQLLLFIRFKSTQKYALRQQMKAVFGILLASFLYYNQEAMFYFGYSVYLIMKFQILNGVKLKLMIENNRIGGD